jgi:hypothetical protein
MENLAAKPYWWWFWVSLIRTCGLPFQLSPRNLPRDEARKLNQAAAHNEVVIIFNPGGWGDAALCNATDFAQILKGIQETLDGLGYQSIVVPYNRVRPGFAGKIAATKEQLNSFKHTCEIQTNDIEQLSKKFPEKKFLIAGFSVGGGLSAKTLKNIADLPNVCGITVGTPGWYSTHCSEKSLVLNNNNQDPIAAGDVKTVAVHVFRCPARWLRSRLTGRRLSLALAMQFPHHDYPWSSPEVGLPIIQFLETHFKSKRPL